MKTDLVISILNDSYSIYAEKYAYETKRAFRILDVDELEELTIENCKSIVFIVRPELLDTNMIYKINKLVSKREQKYITVPWGIITATDEERLIRLLERNKEYKNLWCRGKNLYITTEKSKTEIQNDTLEIFDANKDIEAYKSIVSNLNLISKTDVLIMEVHGRQYCCAMHPKEGMFAALCSSAKEYGKSKKCGKYFKCYAPESMYRIDIEEINVNILFLATCHGITFSDGFFPMDNGLGLKFVSNKGLACISSFTTLLADNEHIKDFYELLMSGDTLGECVKKINNKLVEEFGVVAPYILLGDPLICFCESSVTSEIKVAREIKSEFFDVVKRNFSFADLLSIKDFVSVELYQQIERIIFEIKKVYLFSGGVVEGFYSTLEVIHKQILLRLYRECVTKWFYEYYKKSSVINRTLTCSSYCPNCGNKSETVFYENKYDPIISRRVIMCPKCGISRDESNKNNKICIDVVLGNKYTKMDGLRNIKVIIGNNENWPQLISLKVLVYLNAQATNDDQIIQVLLEPGQVVEKDVCINFSVLNETLHYLRVISIVNFEIKWFNIPFLVCDKDED